MNALLTIVLAVQILTALCMIGLILVQHGKDDGKKDVHWVFTPFFYVLAAPGRAAAMI